MDEVVYQADLDKALWFLKQCLAKHAPHEALSWLDGKEKQIHEQKSDKLYFITFSEVPNHFGKTPVNYSKEELEQAKTIRKNWNPQSWNLTQLARACLILSYARHRQENFKATMDKIFNAADTYELITLYEALPLFPNPEKFLLNATNGIRNNMTSVIDAITLNNPYPADYFDEIAWNQLVLKTFFVDSPIEKVIGLKRRANANLSKALLNTIRERSSAGRPFKLEMWCLIGFGTNNEVLDLLKTMFNENNPVLQNGVLLACDHCSLPEAKTFFNEHQEKHKEIEGDLQKLREFDKNLVN